MTPAPVRPAPPPPRLSPDTLHRNLAALETIDPDLARRVRSVDPSADGWRLAHTRDGRVSFQRARDENRVQWLGRTSLPGVRAEALLEQFDPGRANVLIPGLAEGSEVVSLLRTLGDHRAVFVWDESLTDFALVLRVHDVADAVRTGRVVFLVCAAACMGERLLAWLREHPGHLCPERLMMWPWQSPAELSGLRAAVEVVYRTIQQEREAELERLRALTASRPKGGDVLAILAMHAREEVRSSADALAAAARAAGVTPLAAVVRGPADVHALAFARAFQMCPACPARAILIEITRRGVQGLLADQTPAVSWISPATGLPPALREQFGPRDHLAVTTDRLKAEALAAGATEERIHVVPPACPLIMTEPDAEDRPDELVLLCDLPPVTPEAYGFRLPTHVHVWKTALELIEARIDGLRLDQLDTLLKRAEEKTGVSLLETKIRQALLAGLRCAAQNLFCSFISRELRQTRIPLKICGTGWKSPPADRVQAVTQSRRVEWARSSRAVLHLDLTGERTGDALLAAGCGSLLIAVATPFDAAPGGLETLLRPCEEYVPFRTLRGLLQSLDRLQTDPSSSRRIRAQAHARCLREHTFSHRLQAFDAILSS